jgi:hypothetical protein
LEKVKQREKEIFALSKDIRVLSTQLLEPIPANCNIDVTNSTCDLSYGFVNSLKQTEAELRSIVQRNISLVRESLPFLVYYLKEMNLYDELSFIFSHCDQWEEQGEFIQSHHSIIGPDVYRTLHNGQQYTYSHFDRVIQSKLNMALIPSVRDLPPPQPQSTKTRHSIMDTNLNPDTDYIFDHYALDYSQFPVDVPFVQELQQKVLLLQTMYRERADFALNIGDKIRNLWELTETSTDESQAWMERCQDLSMLNLRHFQLELIRLCDKKMELLPKWVNNHEEMIRLICSKLGTSDFEIEEKLQLCRQQMTLDDHLQSLRLELTQLRANLAVRQPILDKITAFKSACEAVDNVKKLQDDPNRFKGMFTQPFPLFSSLISLISLIFHFFPLFFPFFLFSCLVFWIFIWHRDHRLESISFDITPSFSLFSSPSHFSSISHYPLPITHFPFPSKIPNFVPSWINFAVKEPSSLKRLPSFTKTF